MAGSSGDKSSMSNAALNMAESGFRAPTENDHASTSKSNVNNRSSGNLLDEFDIDPSRMNE